MYPTLREITIAAVVASSLAGAASAQDARYRNRDNPNLADAAAVSYTHLTLPTILRV